MKTTKREYATRFGSFPELTITFLKQNGISKSKDIVKGIGLDKFCTESLINKYGYIKYPDRPSYYFSLICSRLMNAGLIERVNKGIYKLSKKGNRIFV